MKRQLLEGHDKWSDRFIHVYNQAFTVSSLGLDMAIHINLLEADDHVYRIRLRLKYD